MQFLDFGTLIFIVAAVFIFLKLRNVLGTRSGHEKPPYNPFAKRENMNTEKPVSDGDNVVALPRRKTDVDAVEAFADLDAVAAVGTPFNAALRSIRERDAGFAPDKFLEGAKLAYEMIVLAFADGDRKTLKNLLAKDVNDGFSAALDEREKRGEKVQSSFVGIKSVKIVDAEVKGSEANLTLRIASEIITATIGKDGAVIEGDPETVTEVTDVWTFARDLKSRDPNWKLAATEADE
jgi:predicted lipid-binding transport protein (Tim44 family)